MLQKQKTLKEGAKGNLSSEKKKEKKQSKFAKFPGKSRVSSKLITHLIQFRNNCKRRLVRAKCPRKAENAWLSRGWTRSTKNTCKNLKSRRT